MRVPTVELLSAHCKADLSTIEYVDIRFLIIGEFTYIRVSMLISPNTGDLVVCVMLYGHRYVYANAYKHAYIYIYIYIYMILEYLSILSAII